jgi:dihydropteroate synthase
MLDIGGESTRPGASRIPADEQIRRVVPAILAIRRQCPIVPISIDTTLAPVARAALDSGADAINDVSAGLEDTQMFPLAASRSAALILMHRLRTPERDRFSDQYTEPPVYAEPGGVLGVVSRFLDDRAAAAIAAGVDPSRIAIDPGLGFGKTVEQNLELIRQTPSLAAVGYPVVSALSRKSFTARAAGLGSGTIPGERIDASVGLSVAHLLAGARLFRVHDVGQHSAALSAAWAATAGSPIKTLSDPPISAPQPGPTTPTA